MYRKINSLFIRLKNFIRIHFSRSYTTAEPPQPLLKEPMILLSVILVINSNFPMCVFQLTKTP
mgnify:CR=1 FL=1